MPYPGPSRRRGDLGLRRIRPYARKITRSWLGEAAESRLGRARTRPILRGLSREPRVHRAGIEDVVRVESGLDPVVEFHDVVAEVGRQPRGLEPADPVLTGDRPAEVHRQVHDLAVGDLRALLLLFVLRVEDEQGMGVAVAGVGDDGDRDLAFGCDRLDAEHQVAEL